MYHVGTVIDLQAHPELVRGRHGDDQARGGTQQQGTMSSLRTATGQGNSRDVMRRDDVGVCIGLVVDCALVWTTTIILRRNDNRGSTQILFSARGK